MDKGVPIDGFPNYSITKNGQVYNSKGICLMQETTRNGYKRVSLSNREIKHKKLSVHRLVAQTFIPNPDDLPQVNHINEDKTDNRVENLEWTTPLRNLNYSGVIDKASVAKFTRVKCLTTGRIYSSIKEAAEEYGVPHANIVDCCNGRRNHCAGVQWSYVV